MKFATILNRIGMKALGFALVLSAMATVAHATPAPAPEVDPGSIGSALSLLAGGAFLLSAKSRKS
jgi:hypothetical protein